MYLLNEHPVEVRKKSKTSALKTQYSAEINEERPTFMGNNPVFMDQKA